MLNMSLRDLVKEDKKKSLRSPRTLTRQQVKRLKKRGYDAERELVQMFRVAGFEALRIPVSAPSNEPFPDVFAIKDDCIIALEVKSQERYTYFKRKQINKLFSFLEVHKYYPRRYAVLASKFKYKDWTFLIADKKRDYSIRAGEGLTFKKLIEIVQR